MKIKLESNFTDWYDHEFYQDGDVVWQRNHIKTPPVDMFRFLAEIKTPLPQHGMVSQIAPTLLEKVKRDMGITEDILIAPAASITDINVKIAKEEQAARQLDAMARETQLAMYNDFTRVVVYLESGNVLLPAREALVKHPDAYCAQYIPTRIDGGSFSQTVIHVGGKAYIVESNSDTWRSTKGAVQVAVTNRFDVVPNFPTPSPIFSITFVPSDHQFIAVDANFAPKLELIKNYVESSEIYKVVEAYLSSYRPN